MTQLDSSALLLETNLMVPPTDLDRFFKNIYEYHNRNGIVGLFLYPAYQIFLHTFVIIITGLCIGCIDWHELSKCDTPQDLSRYISFGNIESGGGAIAASIYVVMTCGYVIWMVVIGYSNCFDWFRTRKFYRKVLGIERIDEVTWPNVVHKMSELQRTNKIVLNKEDLTPLDVAIRILRVENYLIALVQSDVLQCGSMDEIVTWNIWWTLLEPMFAKRSWKLDIDNESFRMRCLLLLIVNILMLPITLLLRIAYFFLKSAELAASPRPSVEIRAWTGRAKWVAREYNEYSYVILNRLRDSSKSANSYLAMCPSHASRRACALVKFIAGSLVGCISLLAVFQDEALVNLHVANRNLLWWLALGSGIYTIARVLQPAFCRYCPGKLDKAVDELGDKLKYHPETWRNHNHKQIQVDLDVLYPYLFMSWLRSLKSLILVPYTLYKWMNRSDEIVFFISSITTYDTLHGDVCTHSLMEDAPINDDDKASRSFHSFFEAHGSLGIEYE